MTAFVAFIFFCQALGSVIGVGMTVWGELAYIHALRDGRVDHAERMHLNSIAHALRFGMTLILTSSLAILFVAYMARSPLQPALTTNYWMLVVASLAVVYVSWALSRKRISFALGSAIAFTGWWFLAYLTFGFIPDISFGASIAFLVVATGIFYALLEYARFLARPKK